MKKEINSNDHAADDQERRPLLSAQIIKTDPDESGQIVEQSLEDKAV